MAAATIALGFGGVIVLAPQASAGTNSLKIRTVDRNHGGSIQFFHSGDKITVCDTAADGKSVFGRFVTYPDYDQGRAAHPSGKGDCDTVSRNVPESHSVRVEVWLVGANGVIPETWNYTYARA